MTSMDRKEKVRPTPLAKPGAPTPGETKAVETLQTLEVTPTMVLPLPCHPSAETMNTVTDVLLKGAAQWLPIDGLLSLRGVSRVTRRNIQDTKLSLHGHGGFFVQQPDPEAEYPTTRLPQNQPWPCPSCGKTNLPNKRRQLRWRCFHCGSVPRTVRLFVGQLRRRNTEHSLLWALSMVCPHVYVYHIDNHKNTRDPTKDRGCAWVHVGEHDAADLTTLNKRILFDECPEGPDAGEGFWKVANYEVPIDQLCDFADFRYNRDIVLPRRPIVIERATGGKAGRRKTADPKPSSYAPTSPSSSPSSPQQQAHAQVGSVVAGASYHDPTTGIQAPPTSYFAPQAAATPAPSELANSFYVPPSVPSTPATDGASPLHHYDSYSTPMSPAPLHHNASFASPTVANQSFTSTTVVNNSFATTAQHGYGTPATPSFSNMSFSASPQSPAMKHPHNAYATATAEHELAPHSPQTPSTYSHNPYSSPASPQLHHRQQQQPSVLQTPGSPGVTYTHDVYSATGVRCSSPAFDRAGVRKSSTQESSTTTV